MKFINFDFSKMSPELTEVIQDCFKNLGLPLVPTEAKIEQLTEFAFMALVIDAIQLANASNVSLERRREIMAEMILLDKRINERSVAKAHDYVKSATKAHLN